MSDLSEAPCDARVLDVEPWPSPKKKRAVSKLAQIGRDAQRAELLASLTKHGWSLVRVAEELDLYNGANVIRTIRHLGLDAEYKAAKERGDVHLGPRRKS